MVPALIEKLQNQNVTLIAVTKTRSFAEIQKLYDLGIRDFGENRVPELVSKYNELPKDIRWHLIGHLQSNKLKLISPFVHMIHSVDSVKLLEQIENQSKKHKRKINVLLQFKVAQEESKYGFPMQDFYIDKMLYPSLTFCGVMGMASFVDNQEQIRSEFKTLANIFHSLKADFFNEVNSFKELSMGMSGDYNLAIKEGSTMVRIGSLLFQ